jgi:Protein of unknown function (DUF3300)
MDVFLRQVFEPNSEARRPKETHSKDDRATEALIAALSPMLRALTTLAASLILAASVAPQALAQGAPPPAQQQAQPLTAQQLDQLVAPIALYPDDLLGQILTASTYPLEAVLAARWSAANPSVNGAALESAMQQQPWDPSIKALTSVPQVLAMMSDKLDWTQALGDAYLSQPDDVAAAIQRMRLKAQAAGNLQATSQLRIRRVPAPRPIIIDGRPEPEYIVIEPVDPDVIFVPVYNPVVVFGPWTYPIAPPFFWSPPGFVAVGAIGFGAPIIIGSALWAHYNWESHHVDINVVNYNKFNHTNLPNNLASQTWEHNPLHRGNIPYNNAVLQQKFGKAATSNATLSPALQKTTPIVNPKGTTPLINNNAITDVSKNGGIKATDLNKNNGIKSTDLKVEKNTKLNVNEGTPINNTGKGGDRHVKLTTDTKIKPVINNPVPHNATIANVPHNAPVVRAPVGGGAAGGNKKDRKLP